MAQSHDMDHELHYEKHPLPSMRNTNPTTDIFLLIFLMESILFMLSEGVWLLS